MEYFLFKFKWAEFGTICESVNLVKAENRDIAINKAILFGKKSSQKM